MTSRNTTTAPEPADDFGHANDEMLTLKETALLLRVPEATMRFWRHRGDGPRSFKVGRHVRYWRTDVWAWLQRQTDESEATDGQDGEVGGEW